MVTALQHLWHLEPRVVHRPGVVRPVQKTFRKTLLGGGTRVVQCALHQPRHRVDHERVAEHEGHGRVARVELDAVRRVLAARRVERGGAPLLQPVRLGFSRISGFKADAAERLVAARSVPPSSSMATAGCGRAILVPCKMTNSMSPVGSRTC